MSKHNDGGPAFPAQPIQHFPDGSAIVQEQGGMTLRDYFADNAPIDYRAALDCWGADTPLSKDDATRASFFAVWAMLRYEWADAMLAARGEA